MNPTVIPSLQTDDELVQRARRAEARVAVAGLLVLIVSMIVLLSLIIDFAIDGLGRIDYAFLTEYPSRRPASAAIFSARVGTAPLMLLPAARSVPVVVAEV